MRRGLSQRQFFSRLRDNLSEKPRRVKEISVLFSDVASSTLCFSHGQRKLMRGCCRLSLAAHPNRLNPLLSFWFFRTYSSKSDDYAFPAAECLIKKYIRISSLEFLHFFNSSGSPILIVPSPVFFYKGAAGD